MGAPVGLPVGPACLVSRTVVLYTGGNSNRFAARLPDAQERQP